MVFQKKSFFSRFTESWVTPGSATPSYDPTLRRSRLTPTTFFQKVTFSWLSLIGYESFVSNLLTFQVLWNQSPKENWLPSRLRSFDADFFNWSKLINVGTRCPCAFQMSENVLRCFTKLDISQKNCIQLCALKSRQSFRLSILDRATLTALESSRAISNDFCFLFLQAGDFPLIKNNPQPYFRPNPFTAPPVPKDGRAASATAEVILAKNLTVWKIFWKLPFEALHRKNENQIFNSCG